MGLLRRMGFNVTVRVGGHGGCMGSPCIPNLHVILMDKGKITAPPPPPNKKKQHKIVMGNKFELAAY